MNFLKRLWKNKIAFGIFCVALSVLTVWAFDSVYITECRSRIYNVDTTDEWVNWLNRMKPGLAAEGWQFKEQWQEGTKTRMRFQRCEEVTLRYYLLSRIK